MYLFYTQITLGRELIKLTKCTELTLAKLTHKKSKWSNYLIYSSYPNKLVCIMNKTKIEWTKESWNLRTGCTKASARCKYCYTEVMAKHLQVMGIKGYENGFEFISMKSLLDYLEKINLKGIDGVIVGGESRSNARPMKEEWVISIKRQYKEFNIPFFFK